MIEGKKISLLVFFRESASFLGVRLLAIVSDELDFLDAYTSLTVMGTVCIKKNLHPFQARTFKS